MREYWKKNPSVRAAASARKKERRLMDGDKIREQEMESKKRNYEAVLARKKAYRSSAAEKIRKYNERYVAENREKDRWWKRKYDLQNPHIRAASRIKRRIAEKRIPPWADVIAIRKIYLECAELNKEKKNAFHVDHIIPLRGKTVSGLHVHNNLQILSAKENYSKLNKWGPA